MCVCKIQRQRRRHAEIIEDHKKEATLKWNRHKKKGYSSDSCERRSLFFALLKMDNENGSATAAVVTSNNGTFNRNFIMNPAKSIYFVCSVQLFSLLFKIPHFYRDKMKYMIIFLRLIMSFVNNFAFSQLQLHNKNNQLFSLISTVCQSNEKYKEINFPFRPMKVRWIFSFFFHIGRFVRSFLFFKSIYCFLIHTKMLLMNFCTHTNNPIGRSKNDNKYNWIWIYCVHV